MIFTGNCDGINGANGQPILIPCSCPPDLATFTSVSSVLYERLDLKAEPIFPYKDLNANVAAGHATNNPSVSLSFPTDSSAASLATRIEASIITLQNLNGAGVGCPAASTTFSVRFIFQILNQFTDFYVSGSVGCCSGR